MYYLNYNKEIIKTISIHIFTNMENRIIDQMYIIFYQVNEAIVFPRRFYISKL